MEEAEQLCHRVAIVDQGRLVAIDTPAALRARVHARRSVEVRFGEASQPARCPRTGARGARSGDASPTASAPITPEPAPLAQLIAGARTNERGVHIESIATLALRRWKMCSSRSPRTRDHERIRFQMHATWVVAKKNAMVYYLKPPVFTFGLIFPFFFYLAFAAGHARPPRRLRPESSRWRSSSRPRRSDRWSRRGNVRREPTSGL